MTSARGDVTLDQRLQERLIEMLDKQEIHERLMRYCRGVDRGDAELVSQAFHPDAMADHGHVFFDGVSVGEALAGMAAKHTNASGTHFTGNELIEIDGDDAYSEVYFFAVRERERAGVAVTFTRCARYIDHWQKRDGVWGIIYRKVVDNWNRIDPVHERWPTANQFLLSAVGRGDAVYQIRTEERRRPADAVDPADLARRMEEAGFATRDSAQ
jgi:hypothetical protein